MGEMGTGQEQTRPHLRRSSLPTFTIAFACLFITLGSPQAMATSPAEAEVQYLLSFLERSDCRFNRNGDWYSASEARAHLEMKYRYLVDQESITTTEDFIDQAATASSMSGKIYLVQCGSAQPVSSAGWLTLELRRLRKGLPAPTP